MHESHAVEALVKQAVAKAKESSAKRITRVNLIVGALSGFQESAIRLYFEEFSQGTLAESALLVVKKVKPNDQPQSFSGREVYIENIEVEK